VSEERCVACDLPASELWTIQLQGSPAFRVAVCSAGSHTLGVLRDRAVQDGLLATPEPAAVSFGGRLGAGAMRILEAAKASGLDLTAEQVRAVLDDLEDEWRRKSAYPSRR
jgi:hypothetical protein